MPDASIGIGIVGAGKAGKNFARALAGIPAVRLMGFCTAHEETARDAAREFDVPFHTSVMPALLERRDIDAVIVASPDEYHCGQVTSALEAGKHVLCEKPMSRTIAEADRMIAASRKNGKILMVGFTDRFNQSCLEAKRKILAGDIGRPRMILARRCHSRSVVRGRKWVNDEQTGGVLNFVGTHNIDLVCWFMDSVPDRVYAEMGRLILKEQDFTDCAAATLKFPGGSMAVLYETFSYPENYPHTVDRSLEILGDDGVLKLDFMSQPLVQHTSAGMTLSDSQTWPATGEGVGGAIRSELEHFVHCVRNGDPPLTGGAEGKLALRIAAAAGEAAESGRAVHLE
jgi:predicted dehydrogenase